MKDYLYTSNTEEVFLLTLLTSTFKDIASNSTIPSISDEEWRKIYQLATHHGVTALLWDAVQKLPTGLQPNKRIKVPWALLVEKIKKRYQNYCKIVSELNLFYQSHGIGMIQLKGVGFSSHYPNPSAREGGDIDIYTYSLDLNEQSDDAANTSADLLMQAQGIKIDTSSYKHSFFYYQGIPIENHKVFLNCKDIKIADEFNQYLLNILEDSKTHSKRLLGKRTFLCNQAYTIQTPPTEFNAIFLAFHALQHLGSGLTLHHLVDWAVLLQKFGWCMPKEVKDPGFLSFVYALNQLCKVWFGIDVGTPNVNEKAELIAHEILHPKFAFKEKIPATFFLGILIYKTKRFRYRHWLLNQFVKAPLSSRIKQSIINHLKKPSTIFNRVPEH